MKPLRSRIATASASPSAIAIVVEVVGARPMVAASGCSGITSAAVASRASVLSARAVIPITGIAKRLA